MTLGYLEVCATVGTYKVSYIYHNSEVMEYAVNCNFQEIESIVLLLQNNRP